MPQKCLQHSERVLRDRMSEVVGPTMHDLIDSDQHVLQINLRRSAGQGTNLVLQRPDWPVGDEDAGGRAVEMLIAAVRLNK